jgi:hypothetical protein
VPATSLKFSITQLALRQTVVLPDLRVETFALAMETEKTKNTANKATTVFFMCSPFRSLIKGKTCNFENSIKLSTFSLIYTYYLKLHPSCFKVKTGTSPYTLKA